MPNVTATVQYIHDDGDHAAYHASEAGGAAATHDGRFDPREVQITDARQAEAVFDLDYEGFRMVPHIYRRSLTFTMMPSWRLSITLK